MTPELLFFILRVVLAIGLYVFLGAVAYLLWRDVRAASAAAESRQRRLGRLVAITTHHLPNTEAPEARTHMLLPVTSIGRAPTNTVPLADETVSLEHALLTLRGGQWWLEDLNSRNGTTVNGVRIDQPIVVTTGDAIGIGQSCLKLELE